MSIYKVPSGADCLVFTIVDDELKIKSYVTSENNVFDESEIIDDPTRYKNGTNLEIDDERFGLANEFAKYGYSVFQRYKNNDESIEDDRCLLAVPFAKVEIV